MRKPERGGAIIVHAESADDMIVPNVVPRPPALQLLRMHTPIQMLESTVEVHKVILHIHPIIEFVSYFSNLERKKVPHSIRRYVNR